MNEELKMKRKEEGKRRALEYLKQCIDTNGTLNITNFRNLHRAEYGKLASYFGSVDNAVAEAGAIKITTQKNTPTVMQRLAYDYICEQIKTKSIAELARKYNVSRATLNQLFKRLQNVIENE